MGSNRSIVLKTDMFHLSLHVVPDIIRLVCRAQGTHEDGNSGSCAWSDAATIIPWTLYTFYGDKVLLAEQYANMRAWTEYLIQEDHAHGDTRLRQQGFHFADWLALDNPDKDSCFGATDPYYVASMYYYWSVRLTAKAAKVLGYDADHLRYASLSQEIYAAILREYFTLSGRLAVPTQTGLALALAMGVFPEGARKRLICDLELKLKNNHGLLTTGFVGTYFLCSVLAENGLIDRAYDLLLNEKMPGWLYEVNMGATTIWERWNSILPDGRVSDKDMNSMNHYAYGSIVEWMYRYMCGLYPSEDAPGFRQIAIRPMPSRRFDSAQAAYDSSSGRFESGWTWEKAGICYRIQIPFNASAEFILPDGQKEAAVNGEPSAELQETGKLRLESGTYFIRAVFSHTPSKTDTL